MAFTGTRHAVEKRSPAVRNHAIHQIPNVLTHKRLHKCEVLVVGSIGYKRKRAVETTGISTR